MKRLMQKTLATGLLASMLMGTSSLMAQQQDRPNFDPEQMRARMMERYRERLEVKDDAEWKLVSERIEKVMTARRESGGGFGGMGMMGGPRRQGGDQPQAPQGQQAQQGQQGQRRFGPAQLPEAEALQKAIEAKASNEEIKAKLASLREARKTKEAAVEKAQDDLRKLVNVRQEAELVLMGVLK